MTKETQPSRTKHRKARLAALILAAACCLGLLLTWQAPEFGLFAQSTPTGTAGEYQTSTVRRGDLAVTISGTGSVVAAQTIDLGFTASGTIADIYVQAGDHVNQGQVLAQLDHLNQFRLAVENQQIAVQTSQKAVEDLQIGADLSLAQARATQASALSEVETAEKNLRQKGVERCKTDLVHDYYFKYTAAQKRVSEWEDYLNDPNTGFGHDYILEKLAPLRKERDLAYLNLTYCQGYTEQEILESQAAYQLAQAKLDQARLDFKKLEASAGVDPQALAIAQAGLKNAELQLAQAQKNLEGTTIIAPLDGTVTAVNGAAGQTAGGGEAAGGGAVITLADLEHPQVKVSIDETDLVNFATGCAAQVTFNSLPGQTFSGVVTQVEPVLVSVRDVSAVSGLVALNETKASSGQALPLGLTASVEITCAQSENTLQAPAQAVYEDAGQPPYVYILNAQGEPEKREVMLGIRTTTFVEILSGLDEGERVITSPVKQP